MPGFLQHVAVLNPNRRVLRVTLEGNSVVPNRNLPLPRVTRPISKSDHAGFQALPAKSRHQSSPNGLRRARQACFLGLTLALAFASCPIKEDPSTGTCRIRQL